MYTNRITVNELEVDSLTADRGDIGILTSDNGDIGTLIVDEGNVDTLTVNNGDINTLTCNTGNITNLTTTTGNITNLTATTLDISGPTVTLTGLNVATDTQILYINPVTGVITRDNIPSSLGDVVGPASSVDNAAVVFDGITGTLIKQTGVADPILFFSGTSNDNVVIGQSAGASLGAGILNTLVGNSVNTIGPFNNTVAVGGQSVVLGNNSVTMGFLSGAALNSVALGYNSVVQTTSMNSVAVGNATSINSASGSTIVIL